MPEKEKVKCFICGYDEATLLVLPYNFIDTYKVKCSVCGIYTVICSPSYKNIIDSSISKAVNALYRERYYETHGEIDDNKEAEVKALLRYYVKKNSATKYDTNILWVDSELCERLFKQPFPDPIERVNYLITFLGDELSRTHRTYYDIFHSQYSTRCLISATASIATTIDSNNIDTDNILETVRHAEELKFLKSANNSLVLTMRGWREYKELKKGRSDSKTVFMAMQFDKDQRKNIDDIVKPVVEKFDFQLYLLPEFYMKENTIDLKLRNAIRDSRLLICDLTHKNNGAYFEAGFAEGLGKPVIYICELSAFEDAEKNKGKDGDKSKRLHFDVEHQEIYKWKEGSEDSIKKFQSDIEAKIRVSITKSN